jgi:hypothetical protein
MAQKKKEKKSIVKIDEKDMKNVSVNAMTGEPFVIPKDDPRWLKNREIDKDGKAIIITPSGKTLEIHRRGMNAEELAAIMLTPNLTSEERNNAVTQYLIQENQDNAMFAAEIFQSRGMYTKEARHFHSQMRLDFENFAGMFQTFLRMRAKEIFKGLGLSDEQVVMFMKKLVEYGNDMDKVLKEFFYVKNKWPVFTGSERILLDLAIGFLDEAETLKEGIDKLTDERERLKGAGTYVSKSGKIYNLHDTTIREIVQKEWLEEHPDTKVERKDKKNEQ